MGVRSKMLAIAAWRLFLLLPTVVGQNPNRTNPLVPEGFTTNIKVKLTYRNAVDKVGPVCGRHIDVKGSNTVIDLPAPDIERNATQVRTAPQVQITGLDPAQLYTYLVVDQSIVMPRFGSRERPFVQEFRMNIRGGDVNTGVVVAPHFPVIPEDGKSAIMVLLYRQQAELIDPNISDYVNTECGLGLRCDFDALQFAENSSLDLVFAGGFLVHEDEFSIAGIAPFNALLACKKLWRFRAAKNPLIGDADIMVGIKAVFKTKETVTEPLCARVFHYMDDEVYVKWNSSKAFPARKVRSLPDVYLWPKMKEAEAHGDGMEGDKMGGNKMGGDKMGDDKMGGDKPMASNSTSNKTAEKKDHWFTLLLVDQTVTDTNSREEPFVNWVVSNIKNTDVSSGDCSVPYLPMLVPRGVAQATFLLYKQSKHIEIDPSEYAKDTPCHFQFRCNWDIQRLVKDKGLELVGALPFEVEADPVSVTHWVKKEMLKPDEGCRELAKFNHEGRMLGECLPKFDAWKALKKELDECVMEYQKKIIMEKMKNMCPELGEHFSKEMKKWREEKKDGDMGGAMQDYKKKGEKAGMLSIVDDMKKEDMEMWIKKFLMDAMNKMENMKEANAGDMMKPDEDMKGPHCIQVVTKYMMMMKKKMMDGADKMDDEGDMDMEEGCKCLKAAKTFMKEHWEKYQAKREAEKDWEKWRSWDGKGDMKDKEDKKAAWDKMMKEMWSKWEEKKDEKDDWESKWESLSDWEESEKADKMKKMLEEMKMKMMKEFWGKMKGDEKGGEKDGESKWDSWENWEKKEKKGEEGEKMKKMLEEMKMKMMKEFWGKMKNWGKDEKKDGKEDKMKMMMGMMMKMKMMREMMEKMKKGGDMMGKDKDWDAKWDSWKNWEKDEKKDGGEDKMKMMMGMMMKMKMMKEMMEKMKKGGDKDWDAKWDSWKNWDKDEKKDGEEDKMKMMMGMMMKMKMMKEMMEKMKKGGDKDWDAKWDSWKNWEKDEKKDGEEDKMKMMMGMMMKMKMMKEMMEKMKKGGDMMGKDDDNDWDAKWDSWKNWEKDEKKDGGEDKMKMMMGMMMKMKMMKEMMEKIKKGGDMMGKDDDNDWDAKWDSWKNWDKDEKKDGGEDKMKMMMGMMMKLKMMKEMMEKMKKGGDLMGKDDDNDWDAKWDSWKNWEKDEKKDGEEDKMKMMMGMMMKMKMMKEMMEKLKKGGDMMGKDGDKDWDAKWDSWKNFGKDEGEEGKMKMMMEEFKKKMMKEFWDKMSKEGEKDKWEKMMEEIKMKMMKEKEAGGDKDMWGKMMEEMRKKWGEGEGQMSQQDMKEKKMAFLVHAFKAFLMKHMAMKDKLDMVHEVMKKKMALEKMCSEEELKKGYDSKCGMMLKELMMKKKMLEMLKESFMDMKEEKDDMNDEKNALVKKMVAGMMEGMKEM